MSIEPANSGNVAILESLNSQMSYFGLPAFLVASFIIVITIIAPPNPNKGYETKGVDVVPKEENCPPTTDPIANKVLTNYGFQLKNFTV